MRPRIFPGETKKGLSENGNIIPDYLFPLDYPQIRMFYYWNIFSKKIILRLSRLFIRFFFKLHLLDLILLPLVFVRRFFSPIIGFVKITVLTMDRPRELFTPTVLIAGGTMALAGAGSSLIFPFFFHLIKLISCGQLLYL